MDPQTGSRGKRLDGCGCGRREFLAAAGLTAAGLALVPGCASLTDAAAYPPPTRARQGATVRALFLYPPSSTFADDPNGWWSWPGNEFDAEGRQRHYTAALGDMGRRLGLTVSVREPPVARPEEARQLAAELATDRPDGLLLVMFYNGSLPLADLLLKAAAEAGVPAVFFVGLGVKHGAVSAYQRPGVYFIQSLDNLEAIEFGLRLINTRTLLRHSRLLSITEAKEPREGVEPFLGTTVRVIPFAVYAAEFEKVVVDTAARRWVHELSRGARELRGLTPAALANAARAHLALCRLLEAENADGLTMNCLRRGMLKPCASFSRLNNALVPAACENDLAAAYTQLLGQLLTGRPGFQHNPCYETERNHYYASHCTCPTRLDGPDAPERPYLLRRFAHTNEGSCAVQVFWRPGEPVTMARYYPGKEPALDVYAGRVVTSHPMPPAAGCTTNVEIEITDRPDAGQVKGHHNLLFCGEFARRFRLFAQLHRLRLVDPGAPAPGPT